MVLSDTTAPPYGLIQQAYLAYKGNEKWPTTGTTKFLNMTAIANRLKNQWAKDANVFWNSLFDNTRTFGTVSAGVQAYDLDDDVFSVSDAVFINRTYGNIDKYTLVHPNNRNTLDYGSVCYLTGQQGAPNLTLNFVDTFKSTDAQIGGTVTAGIYFVPADMINDGDEVPIDNAEWLVYALAAELARNDPAKQDQFPNLLGTANDLYSKMVTYDQGNSFQQPNNPYTKLMDMGVTWSENA